MVNKEVKEIVCGGKRGGGEKASDLSICAAFYLLSKILRKVDC